MKSWTVEQRKIITDFLTTISAGWFGAGVIATFFVRPIIVLDSFINLFIGILFTYITLRYALYLESREK